MSDHADAFTPEQIGENIWATLQGLSPEDRRRVVAQLLRLAQQGVHVVEHDRGYDGSSVEGVFASDEEAQRWTKDPEQAWYWDSGNELVTSEWAVGVPARYGK